MPVSLTLAPPLPVSGVRLASVAAGIKSDGSIDLVLMALPEKAISAAVFTQSHFAAAPVQLAQSHLASCSGAIAAGFADAGRY